MSNDFSGKLINGLHEAIILSKIYSALCSFEASTKRNRKRSKKPKKIVNNDQLVGISREYEKRWCHNSDNILILDNAFVFQAILTHVFVCEYVVGTGQGRVITTLFLVKWSGFGFNRLTWEAQFSLALDIYSHILNYFNTFVSVIGPTFIGERRARVPKRANEIEFFKKAAGGRSSRLIYSHPTQFAVELYDNPVVNKIFARLTRDGHYSNDLGFVGYE